MEKITLEEAFVKFWKTFDLEKRERQVIAGRFFSIPLFATEVWSRYWENNYGYIREKIKGKKIREIIKEKHPFPYFTALVEGGTGLGKTLGYLLPAILAQKGLLDSHYIPHQPAYIKKLDELKKENIERVQKGLPPVPATETEPFRPQKIIVSTATKVLQKQMVTEDLPKLAQFLRKEFQRELLFVKLEGLSNYICQQKAESMVEKYEKALESGTLTSAFVQLAKISQIILDKNISKKEELLEALKNNSELLRFLEETSRDEDFPLYPEGFKGCISCKKNGCSNKKLAKEILKADVIVTNHHYLSINLIHEVLSDFQNNEKNEYKSKKGFLLESFVVFDEAHMFEKAFVRALSQKFRWKTLMNQAESINNFLREVQVMTKSPEIVSFREALALYWNTLDTFQKDLKGKSVILKKEDEAFKILLEETSRIVDKYKELYEKLLVKEKEGKLLIDEASTYYFFENDPVASSFFKKITRLTKLLNNKDEDTVLEATQTGLAFIPLKIDYILRSKWKWHLLPKVFCSATIANKSINNQSPFSFFIKRVGLYEENTVSIVAPSPFPYQENSCLFVDKDAPDPGMERDAWEVYVQEAIKYLANLTGGGTLVLFTNQSFMRKTYDKIHKDLEALGLEVKVQGRHPLKSLYKVLQENQHGVVFGVESLWQGFDVQGQGLRHVIITKLPFDQPDDPLYRELIRLEKEKYHKRLPHLSEGQINRLVFKNFTVPRAVLLFKQGFGRLIRSQYDKGIVSVIDSRLLTKNYGINFLSVLPNIPLITSYDKLKEKAQILDIVNRPEEAAKKKVRKPSSQKARSLANRVYVGYQQVA